MTRANDDIAAMYEPVKYRGINHYRSKVTIAELYGHADRSELGPRTSDPETTTIEIIIIPFSLRNATQRRGSDLV